MDKLKQEFSPFQAILMSKLLSSSNTLVKVLVHFPVQVAVRFKQCSRKVVLSICQSKLLSTCQSLDGLKEKLLS